MIHQPTSDYVASTTLIDIGALTDGDEYGAISDGTLIVTFGTPMMRLTVPDTWNTWNTPPDTETGTPPVLWSEGATNVPDDIELAATQRPVLVAHLRAGTRAGIRRARGGGPRVAPVPAACLTLAHWRQERRCARIHTGTAASSGERNE